jgi:hypothetical protein
VISELVRPLGTKDANTENMMNAAVTRPALRAPAWSAPSGSRWRT